MKTIPLTQGKFAIVDDEDFEELNAFKWCANKCNHGNLYAIRFITLPDGKSKQLRMHREIIKPLAGQLVDHINGNELDNRRENLRICCSIENSRNRRPRKDNASGYKGVSIYQKNKKNPFCAKIMINGKQIHIGYYPTAESAARAYDEYAKKLYKDYAYLNFQLS